MSMIYGGSNVTFPDGTTQNTSPSGFGFKNRIINGAMTIDQRNAGASVAFDSNSYFGVDRFKTYNTVGTGCTVQQVSTVPTSGYVKSLKFTVGTGGSASTSGESRFFQWVEGFNTSDLNFGSATAQTVTVSFWVRSSISGIYALNLRNNAGDRSYVATYAINSVDTWEQKSVTIPGCTDGTWLTDNSAGIMLRFDLGSGTNANTTAGAWQNGNYGRTSACVNWTGTSGATFYITGVQLEKGSTATSFDYRPYGTELALCQRYYWQTAGSADGYPLMQGYITSSNTVATLVTFPTTMRSSPTATKLGEWAVNNVGQPFFDYLGSSGCSMRATGSGTGAFYAFPGSTDDIATFSSEL